MVKIGGECALHATMSGVSADQSACRYRQPAKDRPSLSRLASLPQKICALRHGSHRAGVFTGRTSHGSIHPEAPPGTGGAGHP
jgi:hypothetical protein